MRNPELNANREEARELRYNKGFSIQNLAIRYGKSERTIYRWLTTSFQENSSGQRKVYPSPIGTKKYPLELFDRIREIKEELPQRSAPVIQRLLQKELSTRTPSLSTIRKYIRDNNLTYTKVNRRNGYIKFERAQPNDLWQVDIAGVQSIERLGKLYLIALLDDHSRFIVAAEYFKDQKGRNVLKVLRDAVLAYGRPRQILADNGTQFRNLIGKLGTKYTKLLERLDIKPIFARARHPETKGKLERWFGTVKQMFLVEARYYASCRSSFSLLKFNSMFKEWVKWYNTEKPHRSLPGNQPPVKRFLESEPRFFHPLKANVNWKRWLHELEERTVTKYNEVQYKAQKYHVPPGYSGTRVEVIEYENEIEIYYRDTLLITHPYNVPLKAKRKTRKISHNGTIGYLGNHYNIDYKLAGKTVEVQEINDGKNLLVYMDDILLKTLDL